MALDYTQRTYCLETSEFDVGRTNFIYNSKFIDMGLNYCANLLI
jgi:hypothetical protein